MKKSIIKRIYVVILIVSVLFTIFGCKKKPKHKWIEVGAPTMSEIIKPGVHPERGSIQDAPEVTLISVYYPLGRDKEGKPQYDKTFFEANEMSPETVNAALVGMGLIDDTSEFIELVITDSDEFINAGPGAPAGEKIDKKGIARYQYLSTSMDNTNQYDGKHYVKDLIGLIDMDDVLYCMQKTFEENFQLVSCEIENLEEGSSDIEESEETN